MRAIYIRFIYLILIKLSSSQIINNSTVDINYNSTNSSNSSVNPINTTTTSDNNGSSKY